MGEREYRSGGQGGGGEHIGGGAAAEGGRLGHVTQEEKEMATTTRFMFAQFVLRESKAKEFFCLMERTPAAFVMVLCDRARPSLWHPQYISELLQKQGDVWGAECFEQGALIYKKWRVSAVAECDSGPLVDDKNWAFSSFKVFLRGDDFNPRDTVIAVACVWLKEKGAAGPWGSTLLGHMKERIVGDEVRFLCGLMIGVPREQVEELGRSCGATSTCPSPTQADWARAILPIVTLLAQFGQGQSKRDDEYTFADEASEGDGAIVLLWLMLAFGFGVAVGIVTMKIFGPEKIIEKHIDSFGRVRVVGDEKLLTPPPPPKPKESRDIACQSQTTYTRWSQSPRFHPLPERDQGAFKWSEETFLYKLRP